MAMKILITSGGTTEAIDSVRGITNHATGKLGKSIADLFLDKGHQVTLVTTASAQKPHQRDNLTIIETTNVHSLYECLKTQVPKHQALIHSMAVSDYSPVYMTDLLELEETKDIKSLLHKQNRERKISSQSDYQVLFLKKTPKVISQVKKWNPNILLIGFKLLVDVDQEQLIKVARQSILKNKADYILANDLKNITDNNHHAFLVSDETYLPLETKEQIAQAIYKKVVTSND
ncbi:phosphopantothenate--cysteine ligase [Streptococcus iniae]|nr:phosphopantothenate--cysteine ligase [Streptococcus iniae]